ncbi:MAG TPA: heavy metal-binding domain-containing protein [Gaiellaceae bacterium]|nr:heavy metal-binding domain-containing protein [Gaiellaceae bacterium]
MNEFLLGRQAGFEPLTQVMGSCFYHVGWQWLPGSTVGWGGGGGGGMRSFGQGETWELETETEAWNEARRLALGRLTEEARLAGADAVVGVRLERGEYDWSQGLLEFVASGTAVRSERFDLGQTPVLSNLSGQEFAALFVHGWWPAGLVAGTTVAYIAAGWRQQQAQFGLGGTRYQNQEFADFTRGVYDARSQAMLRVSRQAHEFGAHGLLGVQIDHVQREHEVDLGGAKRRDLIFTFHVLGTAVTELARSGKEPPVYVAVPLS